jgi:hypothetical protein
MSLCYRDIVMSKTDIFIFCFLHYRSYIIPIILMYESNNEISILRLIQISIKYKCRSESETLFYVKKLGIFGF